MEVLDSTTKAAEVELIKKMMAEDYPDQVMLRVGDIVESIDPEDFNADWTRRVIRSPWDRAGGWSNR